MKTVLWATSIALAITTSAGAQSPADVFHRDFAAANKRLQDFYCHAQIVATETFTDPDNGYIAEQIFRATGDLAALQITYTSKRNGTEAGTRRVWVANPKLSFALVATPHGQFFAQDVNKTPTGYQKTAETIFQMANFSSAPWAFFGKPIRESLKEPGISVTEITSELLDNQQVTKVAWKQRSQDLDRSGWFAFRSDWAMIAYELSMHGRTSPYPIPSKLCCRATYAPEPVDGFPIITSARYWSEKAKDGGAQSQIYDFQVDKFGPGDVDYRWFTVDGYDIEIAPSRRWSSFYTWLIVALVLLIIATIVFRYLANRRLPAR